jgi:hypothetical protein
MEREILEKMKDGYVFDNSFFYERLKEIYPETLKYKDNRSWKDYYLTVISYIDKLKRKYGVTYEKGNPREIYKSKENQFKTLKEFQEVSKNFYETGFYNIVIIPRSTVYKYPDDEINFYDMLNQQIPMYDLYKAFTRNAKLYIFLLDPMFNKISSKNEPQSFNLFNFKKTFNSENVQIYEGGKYEEKFLNLDPSNSYYDMSKFYKCLLKKVDITFYVISEFTPDEDSIVKDKKLIFDNLVIDISPLYDLTNFTLVRYISPYHQEEDLKILETFNKYSKGFRC